MTIRVLSVNYIKHKTTKMLYTENMANWIVKYLAI